MKILLDPIKLTFIIALALASLISPVQTQSILSQSYWRVTNKERPKDPQRGGGTRPTNSKCPTENIPLIAFMPASVKIINQPPTFWFFVPYKPKDIDSFSFEIVDEQNRSVQPQIRIPLSGTPGFISLRLPSTSPQFEVGKRYRWYFSVYCDRQNKVDRISQEGEFQIIAPNTDLMQQLNKGTLQERIALYLENDFSYNAFSLLAELRRANPTDAALKAEWDKLLASYNLSNIASQPFVNCCSLN